VRFSVCKATECQVVHTHSKVTALPFALRASCVGDSTVDEEQRVDAMNCAFKQACARLELTGSTPVIELVAFRILELASAGESDPERLTELTVATFQ
jgi:hypothetical protein